MPFVKVFSIILKLKYLSEIVITRKQMRSEVYEYIENWYNKKRRHSALGYKTIEEFDRINLR